MKKLNLSFSIILILFCVLFFAGPSFAVEPVEYQCTCIDNSENDLFPSCKECVDYCKNTQTGDFVCILSSSNAEEFITETVSLKNPLGNVVDGTKIVGRIINAIFGLVGSVALVLFIAGGLTWMTAAGNEEKIKKGRGIIVWAVIGLAVIFFSYAILKFFLSTVMT